MRRVAVFGNAGGGKSTLSRRLAEITDLPLYVIDIIQFPDGKYRPEERNGGKVSPEEYLKLHAEILSQERWIIDGYGSTESAWERFGAADTLVYVDLPILAHYWVSQSASVRAYSRTPKDGPSAVRSGKARSTATGSSACATAT